jgi:hypothetical protein
MKIKEKTNKLRLKSKKIHSEFVKEMNKKLPCLSVGIVLNKDDSPKYLEVIIKRPERYSYPNIMKTIPKTYRGIKVKSF